MAGQPTWDLRGDTCRHARRLDGRAPVNWHWVAAELEAHCRAHLAGHKCPRRWEFTDALPRNEVGKLSKKTLRAPYWDSGRAI